MSYASTAYAPPDLLGLLAIPGFRRARVLRVASLVAGSCAFAAAMWTVLTALFFLG